MTPDWAKNLLAKIAIGAVVFFALLFFTGIAGASDIVVNPSSISVSFSFDQPKAIAHYETPRTVAIQNTNPDPTSTISGDIGSISGDISITPSQYSFFLPGGESSPVTFTIVAAPTASEGTHTFKIKVGEEESITVTVTITYYAKIEVSPPSIDFGRVSRTENPSKTASISEKYGYKGVTINLLRSGNSWVTGPASIFVPAGGQNTVTFLLTPGFPDRNEYSWTFSLSSPTSHTTITPSSIYIEAYILMPPKLGRLHDEELELKFDKPKGTVLDYERDIEVRVRNDGDETLSFSSQFTEIPSGLTIRIVNPSGSVSGKSSKNIKLHVVAPFDAREGTYRGRLDITAGAAGSGSVDITIEIQWPVDFSISRTSIDFGPVELKERAYEKKSENITLTESFRYKPVRNLRITKSGEYGNWLIEKWDFAEIPPGESRTVTLTIEPGLEAVPQDYLWDYNLRAFEIGPKRMEVKAKIVPLNISQTIEDFKSFRETPLYRDYPSTESIIADGIGILEVVEGSEVGAEDWQKIPVLVKGTLSLLSSLNDGIVSSEGENYGNAVESLSAASGSTSTIESNSNLNNGDISGFAKEMSAGAGATTEEVLMDAAKLLELRGWEIKKAVEHALAIDDISGLKKEENVLESAMSYQYAATLYGLLNEQEKRLENVYEESVLMDKHDVLVSDATELRITAENTISNSKENDLMRIWDMHLLFNPYNYDTFLQRYITAESDLEEASKKYKVAGELLLADNTTEDLTELKGERRFILSLFFVACILYGVLFIYAISRIIGGTMAYMRDMYEREAGDILVS